jgi:hypothetical protein
VKMSIPANSRYSSHLIILIGVIIVISSLIPCIGLLSGLAESPSFPRQEITSPDAYDWHTYGNRTVVVSRECLDVAKGSNLDPMESVSYHSNGTILDVTFWLSLPFKQHPVNSMPDYSVIIWVDPSTNPYT